MRRRPGGPSCPDAEGPDADLQQGSLLVGTSALLGSRLLIAALGWAGTVLIARSLSPGDWGRFSVVFAVLGVVGLLADLQVSRVVLRDLLDDRIDSERVVGSFITFRLLVGIVAYALAVGAVATMGYGRAVVVATAVAGLSLVLASLSSALVVLLQSRVQLVPIAVAGICAQTAQFVTILAVLVSGRGSVVTFAAPEVLFQLLMLVILLVSVLRHHRIRPVWEVARWRAWLADAALLAVAFGLASLYSRIDLILVSQLASVSAAGVYGVGYKFADLLGIVPAAVLAGALTLMVRSWPDDPPRLREVYHSAFVLLSVAGIGAVASFAIVAHPLISLLYGEQFAAVSASAVALVIAAVVRFFSHLMLVTLIALKRSAWLLAAAAGGLTFTVGANVVVIPRFSFQGAAAVAVATEVLVACVLFVGLRRTTRADRRWRLLPAGVLARAVLAGALAAALGRVLLALIPWPAVAVLIVVIYVLSLHVLRVDGRGGLRRVLAAARFQRLEEHS